MFKIKFIVNIGFTLGRFLSHVDKIGTVWGAQTPMHTQITQSHTYTHGFMTHSHLCCRLSPFQHTSTKRHELKITL